MAVPNLGTALKNFNAENAKDAEIAERQDEQDETDRKRKRSGDRRR
jgi:hypothetical protein